MDVRHFLTFTCCIWCSLTYLKCSLWCLVPKTQKLLVFFENYINFPPYKWIWYRNQDLFFSMLNCSPSLLCAANWILHLKRLLSSTFFLYWETQTFCFGNTVHAHTLSHKAVYCLFLCILTLSLAPCAVCVVFWQVLVFVCRVRM